MDNGKEKYGFTINEIFEMAARDEGWEVDPQKRKMYVLRLKNQLMNLT